MSESFFCLRYLSLTHDDYDGADVSCTPENSSPFFSFEASLLAHEIGKSAPCAPITERSDMTNTGLVRMIVLL